MGINADMNVGGQQEQANNFSVATFPLICDKHYLLILLFNAAANYGTTLSRLFSSLALDTLALFNQIITTNS